MIEDRFDDVVTLKVFGDESADETRSRVFAVTGIIGSEDDWQLAMREWLRRTRGLRFHANECESKFARHPDPEKHRQNLRLYADLTRILAGSYLTGYAVALDLQSHRALFPGALPDTAYYKCLGDVVRYITAHAQRFNALPEEPEGVRVEFTFDSRQESDGTAGILYTTLRSQPEWADPEIIGGKVTFAEDELRIEIADLVAREAMKELDRKITKARPEVRKSRQVLEATNRFRFIEHDRAYCEEWKAASTGPEAIADRDAYAQWLHETGRVQNGRPHDTLANRYTFLAWSEARARLKNRTQTTTIAEDPDAKKSLDKS